MTPSKLPSVSADILKKCPRFRILLVGKSGTGKSSLINYTFNVDVAAVSHGLHGVCDINTPIISAENSRFVLHDSQGFEPGETGNLNTVKDFILSRGDTVDLKDQVHAVWLCAEIPFAGGRVFEIGDEEFLKLGLKVPIVVVFTKFDNLVAHEMLEMMDELTDEQLEMEDEEMEVLARARADKSFETLCVSTLHRLGHDIAYTKVSVNAKYRQTLANLIDITQNLVSSQDEGDIWIVSAMAQRASAQAKINSSIKVGMKRYWQGLASSAHFAGYTLEICLNTIHSEIVSGWNFCDPDNLLDNPSDPKFRKQIMAFAQEVTPEVSEASSRFSLGGINSAIGVTTAIAGAVAPVTAVAGLSAIFIRWITEIYKQTPDVLRCLMGHIVDLTLVMDSLFLNILPLKPPRRLTWETVDDTLEEYKITRMPEVHRQIREYANASSFAQTLAADNADKKIVALIQQYRSKDPHAV